VKYSELLKKPKKELVEQDKELRAELFQLRIKHKTSQLEDKSRIGLVRKDIARIQSRITEIGNGKENE